MMAGVYGNMESGFVKALNDAGLIPAMTSRVIIDIPCDGAIAIYYKTFADKDKIDSLIMTNEILAELKESVK